MKCLTWHGIFRISIAEAVYDICKFRVLDVEACDLRGRGIMVCVRITSSAESNGDTVVPLQ